MKKGGRERVVPFCFPTQTKRRKLLASDHCGSCFLSLNTQSTRYYAQILRPFPPKLLAVRWQEKDYQREFLDRVGQQLGVTTLDDWYNIPRVRVERSGGRGLFNYYATLEKALRAVYPEHAWDSSSFLEAGRVPSGYWQKKDNIVKALDKAEKVLGITKPEDWYTVNLSDLTSIGFPKVMSKVKLMQLLSERYPKYKWDRAYILRGRFAQQQHLQGVVTKLFPDVTLLTNCRKEAGLVNPQTGQFLELDIWLPSLHLAFEFQERHHYMSSQTTYLPIHFVEEKDKIKKQLAQEKGITLIVVPFWWDGQRESLVATIRQHRPDLCVGEDVKDAKPIPIDIPPEVSSKPREYVEDIGQPVAACFFTRVASDPTDWWLFEKYDGLRGFWNPTKKAFYSRHGNQLLLPTEIIDSMPQDIFLDGELWFGRDNFQESLKVSSKAQFSEVDWSKFKYMVFDHPTSKKTYGERYKDLQQYFTEKVYSKHIELAPMERCKGMEHLEEFLQDIIDKGGEGIILRNPDSPYESGRSSGFLKHKKFRDAEAKIVSLVGPGQYECELPNGATFVAPVGTNEFLKKHQPKPGDIVSFKHAGFLFSSKKPKLPAIYRLRPDLTWQDVIDGWKDPKIRKSAPVTLRKRRPKPLPKGYWADKDRRITFFTELAKEMGLDPALPDTWNKITHEHIRKKKGGRGLLVQYGSSIKKAISATFPEQKVAWKVSAEKKPRNYWRDAKHLREFLDGFAKEKAFDPLIDENWYLIETADIRSYPAGASLLRYWKLRHALMAAYPEVHFALWKNATAREQPWQNETKLRNFFDEFAREAGFDPSIPDNWYAINLTDMKKRKGGLAIQVAHAGGFKTALQKAYPEISFLKWAK